MKHDKLIDYGALRIFAMVAECDTMTQAASRLGITQSAVSQAIKQIETLTGAVLIERRSRPTKLTPSGLVMKEHVDRLLVDSRKMLNDVRLASTSNLGRLNIGVIDSFGDMAARQLVQRARSYAAKLALRSGLVPALSQALIDGDLDVFITSDPLSDRPEFGCFPVLRDPFVMLVPEALCENSDLSPKSLVREMPFIRYGRQSRIGVFVDLIARRLGIDLPEDLELDSTQTMMRFVQAGQGWAITSSVCFIRYPELLEGVRIVELANNANARNLCLLHRHRELGDVPQKMARDCREIFEREIVPQILEHAPWLKGHVHSITDMPVI